MTWPGTHPDTAAGKPNTTDPAEPENHTPTKAPTPTTEWPTRPQDDTTAGQNDPEASTKSREFHAENGTEARMLEPESATPDTDSPPSADHDTASENSSNTHANTDPSPSDASDANHRSATGEQCGARAYYCLCTHAKAERHQIHDCLCGGSWMGEPDTKTFRVHTLPAYLVGKV